MVKFARCNALLSLALDASGKGCRYVAKGETDDEVVKDMSAHMSSVHKVDGSELETNIRGVTRPMEDVFAGELVLAETFLVPDYALIDREGVSSDVERESLEKKLRSLGYIR